MRSVELSEEHSQEKNLQVNPPVGAVSSVTLEDSLPLLTQGT